MLFLCPKCREKLNIQERNCTCKNGHSYDKAKEGYYNLLLGNGGIHGDNKLMVDARRDFLSRGHYYPLARLVADEVLRRTEAFGRVLDSGSGEGYYTDIVESSLCFRDGKSCVFGFDISKDAVKRAAKRNPLITYAVASSYKMPIADGSVDTVYNIFSPLAGEETLRVLKCGGYFIMAIPDAEHLFELKSLIYDTPYKNTVADTALSGFGLIEIKKVDYVMKLSSKEEIRSLFMMTPYAYRTKKENAQKLESVDSLDCRAQFLVLVYKKL